MLKFEGDIVDDNCSWEVLQAVGNGAMEQYLEGQNR